MGSSLWSFGPGRWKDVPHDQAAEHVDGCGGCRTGVQRHFRRIAIDDAYLATLKANGIPIDGEDYVIALGQEVCRTARTYPSMQVIDLAMGTVTSEYEPRPYDYSQARVIIIAAFSAY